MKVESKPGTDSVGSGEIEDGKQEEAWWSNMGPFLRFHVSRSQTTPAEWMNGWKDRWMSALPKPTMKPQNRDQSRGVSLLVPWLWSPASTPGVRGSSPSRGTRIPHPTCHVVAIFVYSLSCVRPFCDPMDYSPVSLLCPGDFPGKNTGVGCHFLLLRSSGPRGWTCVSWIGSRFFTTEPFRKTLNK